MAGDKDVELIFTQAVENLKSCISKRENDLETSQINSVFCTLAGTEIEKKVACDQALREVMKAVQLSNVSDMKCSKEDTPDSQKVNGDSKSYSKYTSLITYTINCAKHQLCTTSMPILLLCDVFEVLTLDKCEELFDFVEDNVTDWTAELFFSVGKNHLLRMCNDLLRRLSKSLNTVFCGRIQLFLARLFPIEEKSALNLTSQFNVENITLFKKSSEGMRDSFNVSGESDRMETEEGELPPSTPTDFNLYFKLWSLQDFFRNPSQCYTPIGWRKLKENTTQVVRAFSSHKLEQVKRRRKSTEVKGDANITFSDISAFMAESNLQRYFPKFLTNENLMDLQLNDSNFRRHLLVQFLILFQYLTGNVKFKSAAQVLNDTQSQWLKETTTEVYQLINETPPDGDIFATLLENILKREENWIHWKNDSCPSFARGPDEEEESTTTTPKAKKRARKRSIGEELAYSSNKKQNLGNAELSRLWNLSPENLDACKVESRVKFLPNMEEFFEEAVEQVDPAARIEDEYKLVNKSSFGWRALRLLARRSYQFFTPSGQPFKALPDYLSNVISQFAKDMNSTPTATATMAVKVEENGTTSNE